MLRGLLLRSNVNVTHDCVRTGHDLAQPGRALEPLQDYTLCPTPDPDNLIHLEAFKGPSRALRAFSSNS